MRVTNAKRDNKSLKSPQASPSDVVASAGPVELVALDMIREPETAMRAHMGGDDFEWLKESMSDVGLLYPLLVFPLDNGYEVADGHRRLLAARELGWGQISCIVFSGPEEAREAAKLHANQIREAVNPAEEAVFIAQLVEKRHLDEAGICKLLHRSPDYIGDRLRLLRQDLQVFEALRRGDINFAVARELNKCDDESQRRYYLDAAIRSGCASRVVTQWIADWRLSAATVDATPAAETPPAEAPPLEVHMDHCEMCGGDKDPWNLQTIRVHKWEWAQFINEWRKAGKEGN
jgi:ParB/RepB/Spo0J family partition protein